MDTGPNRVVGLAGSPEGRGREASHYCQPNRTLEPGQRILLPLLSYMRQGLSWVHHQRCVWHFWRSLAGTLARTASEATRGLVGEASRSMGRQVGQELTALLHAVIDACSHDQAEQALTQLREHPWGGVTIVRRNVALAGMPSPTEIANRSP